MIIRPISLHTDGFWRIKEPDALSHAVKKKGRVANKARWATHVKKLRAKFARKESIFFLHFVELHFLRILRSKL